MAGFTKFPNDFVIFLYSSKLSKSATALLLFFYKNINGFHLDQKTFTINELVKKTSIKTRKSVYDALDELDKNNILVYKKYTHNCIKNIQLCVYKINTECIKNIQYVYKKYTHDTTKTIDITTDAESLKKSLKKSIKESNKENKKINNSINKSKLSTDAEKKIKTLFALHNINKEKNISFWLQLDEADQNLWCEVLENIETVQYFKNGIKSIVAYVSKAVNEQWENKQPPGPVINILKQIKKQDIRMANNQFNKKYIDAGILSKLNYPDFDTMVQEIDVYKNDNIGQKWINDIGKIFPIEILITDIKQRYPDKIELIKILESFLIQSIIKEVV